MTDHTMLIFLFAIGAIETAFRIARHVHTVYWLMKQNRAEQALAESFEQTGGQYFYPSAAVARPKEGQ